MAHTVQETYAGRKKHLWSVERLLQLAWLGIPWSVAYHCWHALKQVPQ